MKFLHTLANRRAFRLFFAFVIFTNTLNLAFLGITFHPLFYAVMVWGGYILLHDLCTKELFYRGNHILPLLGYLLCISVATLHNTYQNEISYAMICLQGLIFLLVFAQPKSRTLIEFKQEIKQMAMLVCLLTFIAASISLLMFFFNISWTQNGTTVGIIDGRLFGIYFNCNPAAFLSCMSILFAMLALRNHYRFPYLYIFHILIQLLYIMLTGCRSALLILALLVVVSLYYTLFKRKRYTMIQQIIIAAAVLLLLGVSSYLIKEALYSIPKLQGLIIENSGRFHAEDVLKVFTLLKEAPWENRKEIWTILDQISSSRLELWQESLLMWKQTPIIGIGVNTFHEMGTAMFPNSLVLAQPQVVHTHNFLLETLVVGGLFGFLSFFLFTFKSFTTMLEVLRKYTHTSSYLIVLMFVLIVWIEVFGGFLDYGIFYVYSLSAYLFWLALGYLYWLNEHAQKYLVINNDAYEFVSYRLKEVTYHRDADVTLVSAGLHIAEEDLLDFRYHQRLQVILLFSDEKRAVFAYEGVFQLRRAYANAEGIECYRKEMALELYDIIYKDIIALTSDETWQLELPVGMQDLV